MLTRRSLLLASLALPALAWLPAPARADIDPQAATSFVGQLGQQLVAVANGSQPLAEKQAALAKVIDADVDVPGVARFCLGRFWRTAAPAQQQDYITLFHQVLLRNITGKIGDYTNVGFTLGTAQPRDGGTIAVNSTVTRPGNPPNQVQWLVDSVSGSLKVIDVLAEGTSLRLTQRSDYTSYLANHGNQLQALIDALRRQAAGS